MVYKKNNRIKKAIKNHKFEVFIILIIVFFMISFTIFKIQSTPSKIKEFSPEDVIYNSPITVSHEMTGADISSIPFFPKDQPQPKISVSESDFDFGSVGASDVVTHEFYIQNIGEATLTISRAYTTCGCTQAKFTATVIPPGKVVIMTIVFDAGYHDSRGQVVNRGVIIENNDPDIPQLEIWAQAKVLNN